MHRTGAFTRAFSVNQGAWVGINEVSTGPGNSGGPVWVASGDTYYFAGVLVSGAARSLGDGADISGVFSMTSDSWSLVDDAIKAAGGPVANAPQITSEPTSRRVNEGDSVTLSVAASGTGLTYQWYFNNSAITGATSASLALTNVKLTQSGSYYVIVKSTGGEVRSQTASLAVDLVAPVITADPVSQTVLAGGAATFSVSATGPGPLSYLWTFTATNGIKTVLTNATTSSVTISGLTAANSGSFVATVRSPSGASTTSRAAVLTVTGTTVVPAPANDNFGSRIPIPRFEVSTAPITVRSTNVGATKENGEPAHAGNLGGKSVWWSWSSPGAGIATVYATADFELLIGVYSGAAVGALSTIGTNSDGRLGATETVTFPVTAGSTFAIALDGRNGGSGNINLTVSFTAAVPVANNDQFASRAAIPSQGGQVTGSNSTATRETGEPRHAENDGGGSLWWAWTAPRSGVVNVTTSGSNFDTLLGVYTGTTVGSLALIAQNDDASPSVSTSSLSFNAVFGTTYQFAVDGFKGARGAVNLTVALSAAVVIPNDSFAGRSPIAGSGGIVRGSNIGATKEIGEPLHANDTGGRSLWWSWTAPSAGRVRLTTESSSFDTTLAAYTGSALTSLAAIAANDDDAPGIATSEIVFVAVAGTTYQIAVDGRSGESGSIALTLALDTTNTSPVINDSFALGTNISASGGNLVGNTTGASKESGEPSHGGTAGGRSAWWKWTPAASGIATITTEGSSFDTVLAAYTGSSVSSLTLVAQNDNSGSVKASLINFSVTAGVNYSIAVDGSGGANGAVRLTVFIEPAGTVARNDSFTNRISFPGEGGRLNNTNVGASKEVGEPNHARNRGGRSIWYMWIPSKSGTGSVSTLGSDFDTVLAVYTGESVSSLVLVAENDDAPGVRTSLVTFPIVAGSPYYIAVDGLDSVTGRAVVSTAIPTITSSESLTLKTRMVGLSTRGQTDTGAKVLTAGFTISGSTPKPVIVRAIGPTLASFGVSGSLPDPTLRLFDSAGKLIEGNDNWAASDDAEVIVTKSAQLGVFPLLTSSRDAAMFVRLLPGSYTAQISGVGPVTSGNILVEVFDVDSNLDADNTGRKLYSLSTRGNVGQGADIMIAGFVVRGPRPMKVLIRGIGPALSNFGVTGILSDPQITVYNNSTVIARNDNWSVSTNAAEVATVTSQVGGFALPAGSLDAALVLSLPEGGYTVHLSGVGISTGVALIELYEVP
jgi:hypothetical protein